VSSALAAAFHDDPVFAWMLPDEAHRAASPALPSGSPTATRPSQRSAASSSWRSSPRSAARTPTAVSADRAGHPAYLEATNADSKALYERHGFRSGAPFSVADGPPLWPMWREPA